MAKCRDVSGHVYNPFGSKWHRSTVFPEGAKMAIAGAAGELNKYTGECSVTGLHSYQQGKGYGSQALAVLLDEYYEKGCRRLATNVLTDAGEATIKRFIRWGVLGEPLNVEDQEELVPECLGRGYYCPEGRHWKWRLNPDAVKITEENLGCKITRT